MLMILTDNFVYLRQSISKMAALTQFIHL